MSEPIDDENPLRVIDSLRGLLKDERAQKRAAERHAAVLTARVDQLNRRLEQQNEVLHRAELRLSLVVKQLPWGVVLEDAEGRIVLANQRYCDLFRMKIGPEKLVGAILPAIDRNASALFIEPEDYVARLAEIRLNPTLVLGDILELSDGQIWRRDSVPIETPQGSAGLLHLLGDATEEYALRAELKKALADVEAANRGGREVLSGMSDEMRVPLSTILGLSANARSLLPFGEATKAVDQIALCASSLLGLVDGIFDSTMLAEGRLRLSQGPFSPEVLLLHVVEQLGDLARKKGLELNFSVDKNLPRTVLGDEIRMRQVLVALMGNAIKFTEAGSVQLRAFRPSEGSLDDVCYSISDTGRGISEHELKSAFERYRIDADVAGTGVGLTVCRDLVQLMGGQIAISGTVEKGTCVSFSLPQPALSADQPSALDKYVPGNKTKGGGRSERATRVLLVEDDPHNRLFLSRMLEKSGYRVSAVDGAQAGLAYIKENQVDALVTDISMPGMDGIEMVAALRTLEKGSGRNPLPTVVVTAHATPEYQARCRDVGVDVFLTKPILGATLCRALARLAPEEVPVLLADDSRDARVLLEVCLKQYESPLAITAASSGKSALAACREQTFSIVFLDIFMPDGGGVTTLHELRRLPGYEHVPVVAVTGVSEPDEVDVLERHGFTHVLQKPIDRNKIHRVVRQCLRSANTAYRPPLPRVALESAPTQIQLEAVARIREDEIARSVDTDIRELAPSFLGQQNVEVKKVRELLHLAKFEEIKMIGHNLNGTGASYGFSALTVLGRKLEAAAAREDEDDVLLICQEFERFLASVLI